MNTSRKTVVITEGIYLWAVVQDHSHTENLNSPHVAAFLAWAEKYPIYVEFVKARQFQLFDMINNQF